jgi:TRAP-type C4-dicarboxylate transport system permease small subunit
VTLEPRQPLPQFDDPGAPQSGAPAYSYFGAVTQALNIVGTLMILAMGIAVNADIIGRDAFNHPIPGVLEFIGLSIVAIVFLQMANTLREGRHISNDILIHYVGAPHPRLVAALNSIFSLIGAALMALIVYFVWPIFVENYVNGYYQGTAGIVEVPIWPFQSAIIVGASATIVQFLVFAWSDLRRALGSRADWP